MANIKRSARITKVQSELKRTVSTKMLALYGIGNIVGAGVYVLVGKIAEPAGYLSVLAFLIAALVAAFAALSYAELAARFPVSAGISVYLHEAFKIKWISTVLGLLLVGAGAVSTAALLKGFGGYMGSFLPIDPILLMTGAMLILLAITLRGIKESVGAAAILTIIEVGGLLFLVGSIMLSQPSSISTFQTNFLDSLNSFDMTMLGGIIAASFIAFYAFIGFEDMVNIAEEVKKPQTAYPRAILIAMATVTVLYLAVAIAALGVLSPTILGDSSAPLADAYSAATNRPADIIIVISLLAILNGIIVNIVMGSRFLYGLSKRQWIPEWFAKVSGRRVPARSLIIVGIVALICALTLPIERLAQITSLLLLFVFFAVNISLIIIRKRDSEQSKHLRISPHFMPWLGALASGALLIGQVVITILGLL